MTRRERRAKSRKEKVAFEPQYNHNGVMTYEEYHGVGYERFNDKFTFIKKIEPKEMSE